MHGMVHHKSVSHLPFAHQKIIWITALLITEDSSIDIIQSQKTEDLVELSQLLVPWPWTSHSLSLILSFLTINSGDVLLHSTELWPSARKCLTLENSYINAGVCLLNTTNSLKIQHSEPTWTPERLPWPFETAKTLHKTQIFKSIKQKEYDMQTAKQL